MEVDADPAIEDMDCLALSAPVAIFSIDCLPRVPSCSMELLALLAGCVNLSDFSSISAMPLTLLDNSNYSPLVLKKSVHSHRLCIYAIFHDDWRSNISCIVLLIQVLGILILERCDGHGLEPVCE